MSERKTFREWASDPTVVEYSDRFVALTECITVIEDIVRPGEMLPRPSGKIFYKSSKRWILTYDMNINVLRDMVLNVYNQGLQNLPVDPNVGGILSLIMEARNV